MLRVYPTFKHSHMVKVGLKNPTLSPRNPNIDGQIYTSTDIYMHIYIYIFLLLSLSSLLLLLLLLSLLLVSLLYILV